MAIAESSGHTAENQPKSRNMGEHLPRSREEKLKKSPKVIFLRTSGTKGRFAYFVAPDKVRATAA